METKKCPVCSWEIKGDAKQVSALGKTIVVCCDDCAKEVAMNPEKFIQKKRT